MIDADQDYINEHHVIRRQIITGLWADRVRVSNYNFPEKYNILMPHFL